MATSECITTLVPEFGMYFPARSPSPGGQVTIYKAGEYFFETGNLAHTAQNKTNLPLRILFVEILPKDWELRRSFHLSHDDRSLRLSRQAQKVSIRRREQMSGFTAMRITEVRKMIDPTTAQPD